MRAKSIIFWSFFCVCAGMIGCVPRQVLSPGASTDAMFGKPDASLEAEGLIRAVAKIDTEKSGIPYRARAALILKKPSYLRLEILPLMGVMGLCVITTPQKMMVYLPSKNEVYTGKPSPQNISKFIPLPLDAEEMVWMLTGSVPGGTDRDVEQRLYRENDVWRLDMMWPSGASQTAWFNEYGLIRLKRFDNDQKTWLSAEYFYDHRPSPLPSKIVFVMNDGGYVKITYTDVSVDQTDDISMFDMEMPSGVDIMPLD